MKITLVILMSIFARGTQGSHEEVQKFLVENGHRHVNIVLHSADSEWSRFRPRDVAYTRTLVGNHVDRVNAAFHIFICGWEQSSLRNILEIIVERKSGMSLLIFDKQWSQIAIGALHSVLKILEATTFFYVGILLADGDSMTWYQVISLKSGSAINDLKFHPNSKRIIESYNLQGLLVTSTSLTWAPFYTIDDCNEYGTKCRTSFGYLNDYMNLLAKKLNFTYASYKDLDGDWGTIPKAGPFSLNGTWGGVVGNVILKKYDMSISSYTWNIARSELMQFVPIVRTRRMLALTPQRPAMDFGLFIRAFTYYSWAGIMGVTAVAAVCLVVGYWLTKLRDTYGDKMLSFTIWTFFVVVNAYYGGALTMFFTSSISVPLETERDVIRAYPQWNLMFRKGSEVNIYSYVNQDDPDYMDFWQRHEKDPEGTRYNSEKEGIELLSKGQNVISAGESKLLGYLRTNPVDRNIYFFGHTKWRFNALIFHLNSPLVPMFNQGARYFREKGIEHQLHQKWIGFGGQSGDHSMSDTMILSPGQVFFAFCIIMGAYFLSLAILGVEFFAKTVTTVMRKKNI